MNAPETQTRVIGVVMATGLVILACATVALLIAKTGDGATIEQMRKSNRDFREQIDTKNRAFDDLQASMQRLQSATAAPPQSSVAFNELRGELSRISNVQSQTLVALRAIAVKVGAANSPELQVKALRAGVAALEEEQRRQLSGLASEKDKVAELMSALQVPDEVSVIAPNEGMSKPSLKRYWPYFEAKRSMDTQQYIVDRLKMRLMQEKVDLQTAEQVKDAQ